MEIRAATGGAGHVEFPVHVPPRARQAAVGGEHAGALEVRLRALAAAEHEV